MGTKRQLIPAVRMALNAIPERPSRVIDLFSGTGTVAASLEGWAHVTCGDALEFPTILARARFLRRERPVRSETVELILNLARRRAAVRLRERANEVRYESELISEPAGGLADWMAAAPHPGNSADQRRAAISAKQRGAHELATMYFARGYFSTTQAIWIDALRYAIDVSYPLSRVPVTYWDKCSVRDVLLAAWLAAVSRLCNGPGHTAQFLRARSQSGHKRVVATWQRSVIDEFCRGLTSTAQVGSTEWRARNRVVLTDAAAVSDDVSSAWRRGALYADPPYTKDHYSRYYHVLETLTKYDYPDAHGMGRVRSDRHLSGFCYRTRVAESFHALAGLSAQVGAPLVLSYPRDGLLEEYKLRAIMKEYGSFRLVARVPHHHSTLGSSKGAPSKYVTERVYLLEPQP